MVGCGQPAARRPQRGRLKGDVRKWRPPVASPQGATANDQAARGGCPRCACKGVGRQRPAHKGLPPAGSDAANKGSAAGRRGGRPLAGQLSAAKGRGSDGSGAVRVKEG
ncbi:hypothetical protein BHE74_00057637 [Ensete ventricosum]|nr:hypothetical protein GW17_00035655 [Ensete ventricosum]RWW37275.1 hypothetical protein BHE74_00057637 [Ensete ventricosum]